MEAPDKIFLAFDGHYVAQSSNVKEDTNGNSVFLDEYAPIEYICKDTLLEWLHEQEEHGGPTTTIQHIINRIKTL